MKRVLSLALALAMILSMMPNVFATESAEDQLPSDAGTLGSAANPEVLADLGYVDLTLVAGDTDGYHYSYTAEETGMVTVYISSIAAAATDEDELPVLPAAVEEEETVTGDIVLTNKTTGEVLTLSKDGVDNYGLELTMNVTAGDIILIQVTASAAADITWYGVFNYPAGSEQNPIYPEWTWNEAQTEATATVTAPVGTTYYAVYGAGMILTINGEEYGVLTASGMGRVPAVFTITNAGEAAAEYSLKIAYPAGHQMNPESTELGWNDVSLEANDFDGHYYTYTAEGDGTVTAYIASVTEGVNADIILYNNNTYVQKTLSADGVDNNGMEVTIEVNAGDVLTIQVLALPDASYNYPAADISWVANFAAVLGSEQNPIYPEWTWNEAQTEATATVTVPAQTTLYFATYNIGMILTINGEEYGVLTASGVGRAPAVFSITNNTDAEATYELKVTLPEGNQMNPEKTELGQETVSLEANDFDGYYYTYTAEGDGTVTAYITSVTEGVNADIILYNNNTYVQKTLTADGVDGKVTIEVNAGDVISIQIVALPDASYNYPAADITWAASFESSATTDIEITQQPVDSNSIVGKNATFTVGLSSTEGVSYQWYISSDNGESWKKSTYSTAKSATLSFMTYEERAGWQVYCEITTAEGVVLKTNVATVTLKAADITITYQTKGDREVIMEKVTTAVVNATTSEGGSISYQWYESNDNGQTWKQVTWLEGNTDLRLYIKGYTTRDGFLYRCKLTDAEGAFVYSQPVKLVIKANPLTVKTQVKDASVPVNTAATFTFEVENYPTTVQYQWYCSKDGGTTWFATGLSGYNTSTLTVKVYDFRSGYMYRCLATAAEGYKVVSAEVTVTVKANPMSVTANPASVTVAAGETATFHVEVAGNVGDVTYQWYYQKAGSDKWYATSLPGCNTDTLSVEALATRNGYKYRCQVKDSEGNVIVSEAATLTVG